MNVPLCYASWRDEAQLAGSRGESLASHRDGRGARGQARRPRIPGVTLVKLAHKKGAERRRMMAEIESPNSFRISRRPTPMRFCSIFSQLLQLFHDWNFTRVKRPTRTPRPPWFTCGAVVAMLFSANLGRAHSLRESPEAWRAVKVVGPFGHHRAKPVHARVCQRASAVAVVSSRLLPTARRCQAQARGGREEVSVQEQAVESRRHADRALREMFRGHLSSDQAP